jgi:hypothetical protein
MVSCRITKGGTSCMILRLLIKPFLTKKNRNIWDFNHYFLRCVFIPGEITNGVSVILNIIQYMKYDILVYDVS